MKPGRAGRAHADPIRPGVWHTLQGGPRRCSMEKGGEGVHGQVYYLRSLTGVSLGRGAVVPSAPVPDAPARAEQGPSGAARGARDSQACAAVGHQDQVPPGASRCVAWRGAASMLPAHTLPKLPR